MILREEMFQQTDGLGVLELRGGDLELALFVNGEPLAYDAYDCAGSVGRFTVLLPNTQNLAAQLQIETNAEQGFEQETPLQEQVAPLLKLLPNGSYYLFLEDLADGEKLRHEILDWEYAGRYPTGRVMGYYPETKTLITTQPDKALDESRISFYMGAIAGGLRPALVVLAATHQHDSSFIIDGHHKLQAYARCGIKPRILRIEFGWPESISAYQATQILKNVEYDVEWYLTDKQREA